jgi:hypothetical protein
MGRKEEKLKILKDKCEEINYMLLTEEYINNKTKLDIICNKGHEWHPTFDNFINKNRRCRKCADIQNSINQRLSWEEVLNRVESYGYKMISTEKDYQHQESKLKAICPNGHIYEFYINNFQQGKRCNKCLMSGGEQEISRILNKYLIKYIFNYRFEDEIVKTKPFDFKIYNKNICIEFDGEQHYHLRFKKTLLDLMNQHYIDNIKTQYCQQNNIKLIRIPYWEFKNIENILIKELNLK